MSNSARRFRFSAVLCIVIRKARERLGMSSEAAAAHLNLTPAQYAALEHGATEITIQQIWLVSRVLGTRPRTLWRVAESWAEMLHAREWVEDKHAPPTPSGELEAAIREAVEMQGRGVGNNPAIG